MPARSVKGLWRFRYPLGGSRIVNKKRTKFHPRYYCREFFSIAVLCREEQLLLRFFGEGSPPVETDPGDVCGSSHRTSESAVFVTVEVSVPVSAKSALGQNACPDSGSGLDLNDIAFGIGP